MPKLKTSRAAKKRFNLTKQGKVKRHKSSARHILTKKSRKKKRALRAATVVDKTFQRKIKNLLPYS